jgi:hypothetical protein
MIRSVKKAGKILLAVTTGYVLSFGATQAFSTPPEGPAPTDCTACIESCMEAGFNSGFCTGKECHCY